jgi:hypothetical protein
MAVTSSRRDVLHFGYGTAAAIFVLLAATCPVRATEIGKILFQDDFSNPASGWISADLDHISFAYAGAVRRILVKKGDVPSHDLLPNRVFDNVSIEAEATLIAGAADANFFGIICRAAADSMLRTAYQFVINADGVYVLLKLTGPQLGQRQEVKAGKSDALRTGNATNRIRADCAGINLAMHANGRELFSIQDADFRAGQVGFAVIAAANSKGFEVHFGNFVVREAKP